MLKDIASIKIQGANFISETTLPLLSNNNEPIKATLLYGRNGSGKSTIAKAFKKIKGENLPTIQVVEPMSIQKAPISLEDNDKSHIYIFDEDFVNEKVHMQEDGLGTIVMLGEQADLASAIEEASAELLAAENDIKQKKKIAEEYADVSNETSPLYYIEKMKSALRGDNNWAGRDKITKGNAVNSPISDYTYKTFIHLSPQKTRDELIIDFSEERKKLKEAQSGAAIITTLIPIVEDSYYNFDIEKGNILLKKKIEHPELSEREQYLLGLVQSGKGESLRDTALEFEDSALINCPKCYQPLSEQYKTDLLASIKKVLSNEVKEHQRKLKELLLPVLELDFSSFKELNHYQICVDSKDTLNKIIQSNNLLIQTKYDKPYTPIDEELTCISIAVEAFSTALQQLELDLIAHNQAVTDTNSIKTTLNRINNEIAHYDVIELSRKYDIKEAEKEAADAAYAASEQAVLEKQGRLNDLNAQRDSIDIAIDVINDELKYIFFSKNRMQIEIEDNVYKLLCNGHHVKPRDISVGERNIIGLCYFFASILKGKAKDSAYDEEYLLVIDDPVSSYDFENKIGILSFLKRQFGIFLLGNINTRVLIMTHDLITAIDVEKVIEELIKECKKKFNEQQTFVFAPYELCNCQVKRFENKRNEYTELIKLIYEYGNGCADQQEAYIGNIMRQVLEAFSTFEFKKGIDSVSTDDNILSIIEQERDRNYYKNLLYRIVLNEGSHRYDQTRNMYMDFFAMISESEKRRTAREILCFMYLLNKPHIKAHLGNNKCEEIERWCEAIRNQA